MAQTQRVFDLLMKYEQATDLVDKKNLNWVLGECSHSPLTLVIFSCLAVERGKEELTLDFFRTMFFNGGSKPLSAEAKRAIRLAQEIADITGIEPNVIPILPDREPVRTWGWQSPEDFELACWLMAEDARKSDLLPKNWEPAIWSDIERRYRGDMGIAGFIETLEIVQNGGKHRLLIDQQEKHLENFSGEYHFPRGIREAAVWQVASYAWEGIVLEDVYPGAILLQSEWPWREKDPLYQWLRLSQKKRPLAILHPFPH